MDVRRMAASKPLTEYEPVAPATLIGRDEMNLAEFPIALIADRVPEGQKTLYFKDGHGQLTVTGSDAYGLPTATDTDVIVALIYLTKLRNNLTLLAQHHRFFDVTVDCAMGKTRSHALRGNAVWDALRPVRRIRRLVRRGASKTAFPRRTVGTSDGGGAVVFSEE